jgi:deazaflavin-dependent oxidoreductase (nitroreductase family)
VDEPRAVKALLRQNRARGARADGLGDRGAGPRQEMGTLTDATGGVRQWLARWADEPFAYLTTFGRRTGQPHRIEIWFAAEDGRMFLLSGGRDRSDWVRNLQANPRVVVELGGETRAGAARVLPPNAAEDPRARELLVAKYRKGDDLDEWGRTSLPVVIEFAADDGSLSETGASRPRHRSPV